MSESSLNNDEEEVSNCVEVTQETPTKRWRPQTNKTPINPYSTSSKEEVKDKKIYHGWRQVIEATGDNTSPDGNTKKRVKSSNKTNKTQNQQEKKKEPPKIRMKRTNLN